MAASSFAAIEARATSSAGKITINKIEMAQCLLEVYNDKLFGVSGGRRGDYRTHDFKLGFPNALSTEAAANHVNYAALCNALMTGTTTPRQLYPAGCSYLIGWTLLFDREKAVSGSPMSRPICQSRR